MAITAPADSRFKRARARPARRRRWPAMAVRAVRIGLILVVIGYAAWRVQILVRQSRVLSIRTLRITGTQRISQGEVLAVLNGLPGQNILTANLDEWRRRLLSSPWVGRATMRRVLPGTIEVDITERRPIGIGRLNGQLYLVDDRGVVIDEYGPEYAEFDLPIIDGLASDPKDGGPLVEEARAELVGRLLAALEAKPDLARRISQIDVHNPRDAVVILDQDPALLRLGHEQFLERLQAYLELAPVLRQSVAHIDYVDLRFGDRVYVGNAEARTQVRRSIKPVVGAAQQ